MAGLVRPLVPFILVMIITTILIARFRVILIPSRLLDRQAGNMRTRLRPKGTQLPEFQLIPGLRRSLRGHSFRQDGPGL